MIGPVEMDSRQDINNRRLAKKNVLTIAKKKSGSIFPLPPAITQHLHKLILLKYSKPKAIPPRI